MDLSSAQLDEARRRAQQDPQCRRGSTAITWLHASMLQPDLLSFLRGQPALRASADAVTVQFAVQYAFGSEETASRVLGVASALLREGGVFFGVAPDAQNILELLDAKGEDRSVAPVSIPDGGTSGASCREVHLQPPSHPFSLLLRLMAGAGGDTPLRSEFGAPLLFSLEDTVTAGSEADLCTEFLCYRETLVRLAARHGMRPLELTSLADADTAGGKGGGGQGGAAAPRGGVLSLAQSGAPVPQPALD